MKIYRKNLPVIVALILVLTIAAVWFGVQHSRKATETAKSSAYDAFETRRMDLSEKVDATGEVTTEKNAALYSPYSATVKQLLVKPGDTVHTGDPLLILQLKDADVINYAAGYKSSLEQAKSNLIVAQNALERQETLYKIQGTTIDDLESAQKAVRQYEAQVSEYTLKVESLTKNGVDHNNNLIIKAPFDAEVSWINVKEAESVATTDALLTLGGASAIRIEADVDQGDISQIKVSQMAFITANDENRTVIPGIVTSFGSTGKTESSVVTFPVQIKPLSGSPDRVQAGNKPPAFGNKKDAGFARQGGAPKKPPAVDIGNLLKSGMTVDVTIMVNSHQGVLAIPLRAITQVNGENIVKVITQEKLISKKVSLGFQSERYVEILSGLAEGDRVAVPKTQSANPSNASSNNNSRGRIRVGGMGGPPPM